MTVLAYAVIAYLRAEPAAGEVRPLLDRGDATLTAVGVAEVLDHLIRLAGADEEDAALDLAQLGLLEGIVVDSELGGHVLPMAIGVATVLAQRDFGAEDPSASPDSPSRDRR